mgnify:CR=1 FL=1
MCSFQLCIYLNNRIQIRMVLLNREVTFELKGTTDGYHYIAHKGTISPEWIP